MQNTTTTQDIVNGIAEALYDPSNMSLPAPELVTFYKMKSERKYWLDIMVDNSAIELVKQILVWNMEDKGIPKNERKPIWLYLFNYGGDADCAWSVISTMLASETPIYTVNMGVCASAASLIFIAGERRYIMKEATVLIHEGSAQFGGDATKIIDQTDSYKAMLKRMNTYIVSRTFIPMTVLNKKKSNDWELTVEDCMKYGVADTVVENINDVL